MFVFAAEVVLLVEVIPAAPPSDLASMSTGELANEALATYDRAQTAMKAGDWATYGEEQARLQQILELLATADLNATPVTGS